MLKNDMDLFAPLRTKLESWLDTRQHDLTIDGINREHWAFAKFLLQEKNGKINPSNLFIFEDYDDAEQFYELVKTSFSKTKLVFYPGLDASPYSGMFASESAQLARHSALEKIIRSENKELIVITSIESLGLKVPPANFFSDTKIEINESDIISPDELAGKLVQLGYSSSFTIEEQGTFSKKGEIFDIYPVGHHPIRIHYFDEMIEEIYEIDKETLKTIKDKKLDSIIIAPGPTIFCESQYSNNLRNNIPRPRANQRELLEKRNDIFSKLSSGMLFENHPIYTPLFFNTEETRTLLDYIDDNWLVSIFDRDNVEDFYSNYCDELAKDFEDCEELLPEPKYFYDLSTIERLRDIACLNLNHLNITVNLDNDSNIVDLGFRPFKSYISYHDINYLVKKEFLTGLFKHIKSEFKYSGKIIFTIQNENSRKEIEHLIETFEVDGEIKKRIEFVPFKLSEGFFYPSDKLLTISDSDLFSIRRDKAKVSKIHDYDLFAEQLASLKEGDYVIHSKHGIGKYLGLEAMDIGGSKTDYLVLLYKGNDKVFVPIYKMNLIQKHAGGELNVNVDSLRTNKFSALTSRARESIKKLAFDLLKLQAERASAKAFQFSPPDHDYKEFELSFPFNETPDQKNAIDSVIDKMQASTAMDFLVCGDVGFGKTEVAMRAAFKAVLDGKQVAVLVPTTVLALQHYNSFVKRFEKFPVRIDYLSRFKTGKDEKETKEKLEKGEIDIIVGTHKLLGKTIRYKDLGLVIVDEEQRFGVGHKNQLKLLKSSVDFLTLTATPIPRTLQLSFLGLKDLALIKTAPPRRQSIKTYVIKEDDHTIQSAINRELKRGGQVFIVHNRVQDIENYTAYIRELVPDAKIVFAHGQMAEKELESRISAFYSGAYQILISTTIIESGIDIPNANTMIVDRADRYGLAQLHQLRGRIGRSDKKAYCYFVVPNNRNITEVAAKRLKALQTYADMGSGFQIANCDLEIRGAGDILGAHQSGHIEAIGLELYMELLTEAIQELRGEKKVITKDIEINTPFAAFIPAHFISESSERLKYYKQLSNSKSIDEITALKETIFDIYGPGPEEFNQLIAILEARSHLMPCGVKSAQLIDNTIVFQFDQNMVEANEQLRNNILNNFLAMPRKYRFTPDFKLIFTNKTTISPSGLVEFCQEIAEKIVPS
ncbi:transcription-repair coupling factor [Halobacteriovorax sp. RT-2-4]|uniref:transcription-repair coupling factor n=1 Tax=unclassified Halobacteriovorax TaxID=2639665 RepID=UPI00399A592D